MLFIFLTREAKVESRFFLFAPSLLSAQRGDQSRFRPFPGEPTPWMLKPTPWEACSKRLLPAPRGLLRQPSRLRDRKNGGEEKESQMCFFRSMPKLSFLPLRCEPSSVAGSMLTRVRERDKGRWPAQTERTATGRSSQREPARRFSML